MQLTERETDILTTIIDLYIEGGTPVGSRTVSKRSGLGVSAATIRNVMADLTDKGFLEQPHTSAGRIPTASAFRLYLNQIVRPAPLSADQRQLIHSTLDDAGMDISDVLKKAGRTLSSISRQVGMVLAPLHGHVRWKRIEFVPMSDRILLTVLVLQGGILQKKLITLDAPVSSDDLVKYSNYLNGLFADRTVQDVRRHLVRELSHARDILSEKFRRALVLVQQTVEGSDERELFVDGTSHIISQPDFGGLPDLRELMEFLEDRKTILDILDKLATAKGVMVSIGGESRHPAPSGVSLVASPYTVEGRTLGVIGVLGPTRMDYASVVPMVDFTARMITQMLQQRFA